MRMLNFKAQKIKTKAVSSRPLLGRGLSPAGRIPPMHDQEATMMDKPELDPGEDLRNALDEALF